jgi:hypothetical protein
VPFGDVAEAEHILALQRTAGNRAVTGLLQRTKKGAGGAPEAVTAADVTFSGGTPTVKGNARAELKDVGPGHTRIFGPTMSATADVGLASGVELIGKLTVGYIQNMTKGDRVAVYTSDGTPAGKVVAELHLSVPKGVRDAEAHFKQDKNKNLERDDHGNPIIEADAGPPWFASPRVLEMMSDGTPPKPQKVEAHDTPSFPVPLETETAAGTKGKLASIRGSEAFEIALAIKDGSAAPINLTAATWGIDWSMTIDPTFHTATGKPGVPPQPMDPAKLTPGGGLTHDDKMAWWAPVDDKEADAMTLHELLRSLPFAREHDSVVYHRIVNAIHRRSNPFCWHASLIVDEDDSYVGGDTIEVAMEGVRGVKPKPAQTLGTGDKTYLDWELYDLFDPHDITAGSAIKVTIARKGQTAQTRNWVFPWNETGYKAHKFPGDSKYKMSMSLA